MRNDLITKDGKTIDIAKAETVGDVRELLEIQGIPVASIQPRDEEETLLVDLIKTVSLATKVADLIK